jgi:hypothetical protein
MVNVRIGFFCVRGTEIEGGNKRGRDLGYMCNNAQTVAKGASVGLLVPIMRAAISFSHSVLCFVANLPPVTSRHWPRVRVRDSCIAAPKMLKTFLRTIL